MGYCTGVSSFNNFSTEIAFLWVHSIASSHTRLPSEKYGQAEILGHLGNGLNQSQGLCKKFCPAPGLELPGLMVLAMG